MVTPILGHIAGLPQQSARIRVHPNAINQHVLVFGQSGVGKTVALRDIEQGIAEQGGQILGLNFNGTHDSSGNQGQVKVIEVRGQGIPLSLFSAAVLPDGHIEKEDDLCEGIVDVFDGISKLGGKQKRCLSQACHEAIKRRADYDDDMKCLYDCLQSSEESGCEGIIDKFWNILTKCKLTREGTLWEKGAVSIIDMTFYNASTQYMLSELIMQLIFRQHRLNSQNHNQPTWIAVDEFQNLNTKSGSILAQILREGRKFNLGLLLATQTLATFETGERAILAQAGTKLLFRPTDQDARRAARENEDLPSGEILRILRNLQVGECLAIGSFSFGKQQMEVKRPLKIKFQLK